MNIPEIIIIAANKNTHEVFNHVIINCDNSEIAGIKKTLEKEYTQIARKEMIDLCEECDGVICVNDDEFRSVSAEEYDLDADEDEITKINGYYWTFKAKKLSGFGVKVKEVKDGLIITYDSPVYFVEGTIANYSKAMSKTLEIIKEEYPLISYYGYEGYYVIDTHGDTIEQNEFYSKDYQLEIDDYVLDTIKKLWKNDSFWESFEDMYSKDMHEKDLSLFMDKYHSSIGKDSLKVLCAHVDDFNCEEIINTAAPEIQSAQKDKEKALKKVRKDGRKLEVLADDLKNDKEIVMEAVKQNGISLKFASKEIKNNKEVVLEAVKEYAGALKYASSDLQNDEEVVLTAIRNGGLAMEYASEELRKNKDFMIKAVKIDGGALYGASDELKSDKEVVIEAVKTHCEALDYANEKFKNDKEIVMIAIKESDGWALEYASEEMKNDKEVVKEAVKNYARSFQEASEELRNDKDFIRELVKIDQDAMYYSSDSIKSDSQFMAELEMSK